MTQKQHIKMMLIAGLFLISLGGWCLHIRVHPIDADSVNYIPYISGLISVFVIPTMFFFDKLNPYAYVLTGMTVIIGTITMSDFSMSNLPHKISFSSLILSTTLPDILILWSKFIFGKILFDLNHINDLNIVHKGKFLRYPNLGFWWVHLVAMALIYSLGKIFWK